MTKQPLSPKQALEKAERLCAKTEYAVFEIQTKLKQWGIGKEDSIVILSHLLKNKFLDDTRFAESYIRDKYRFCGWGKRKIVNGLYEKRVKKPIIDEALKCIDAEEYKSVLVHFLETKLRTIKAETPRELQQKLFRAAVARGFETDLAVKVVKQVLADSENGN